MKLSYRIPHPLAALNSIEAGFFNYYFLIKKLKKE